MKIHVEYMAQLRTFAGVERELYTVPACATINTLVEYIVARHPRLFGDSKAVPGWVSLVVGDATVSADYVLVENDTVRFLAPMSGG
jgi:molybdopterin converting factor small subunit